MGFSDEAGNSVCLLGDFEAKCFHSATLTHRHRSLIISISSMMRVEPTLAKSHCTPHFAHLGQRKRAVHIHLNGLITCRGFVRSPVVNYGWNSCNARNSLNEFFRGIRELEVQFDCKKSSGKTDCECCCLQIHYIK